MTAADGAPCLHPLCPVISEVHLYVLILASSPKRLDLERNGRYALQAFPQDKPDSDEFYVSGKAIRIQDQDVGSQVISDAQHHVNPHDILF